MNVRFATFMGGWKGKAQLMKAQCAAGFSLSSSHESRKPNIHFL